MVLTRWPGGGPEEEVSALRLCCMLPRAGRSPAVLVKAFSEELVGVRQRGGVELFLMVVRLILPNLTLARIYRPILKFCSDSVLIRFLK